MYIEEQQQTDTSSDLTTNHITALALPSPRFVWLVSAGSVCRRVFAMRPEAKPALQCLVSPPRNGPPNQQIAGPGFRTPAQSTAVPGLADVAQQRAAPSPMVFSYSLFFFSDCVPFHLGRQPVILHGTDTEIHSQRTSAMLTGLTSASRPQCTQWTIHLRGCQRCTELTIGLDSRRDRQAAADLRLQAASLSI